MTKTSLEERIGRGVIFTAACAISALALTSLVDIPDEEMETQSSSKKVEQRVEIQFNAFDIYSPSVSSVRMSRVFSQAHENQSLFTITDKNGRPVSGLYVPTDFFNDFDGGWTLGKSEENRIREYEFGEFRIGNKGEILRVDQEIVTTPVDSESGKLWPLLIPNNALPSESFVKYAESKGHEIYVSNWGQFYISTPYIGYEVEYFEDGIGVRTDTIDNDSYSEQPANLRLNHRKTAWTGQTSSGYNIFMTPTYLRLDGKPRIIDPQSSRLIMSLATTGNTRVAAEDGKSNYYEVPNTLIGDEEASFDELVLDTRRFFSYPLTAAHKNYAANMYNSYRDGYYRGEHNGLAPTLPEFASMIRIADCDVANTDLMIRARMHGFSTRLANGYVTNVQGQNGRFHGWSEALMGNNWKIGDGTPRRQEDFYFNKNVEYVSDVELFRGEPERF